jgi:CRISPR-associated protein Csm4
MKLYRLKLQPRSAWLTPWHADTLAGYLCWTHARTLGDDSLLRDVITPALAGEPPFVLSDAFPGNLLPVPAGLRLRDWLPADRKHVKRARWLQAESFLRAQSGGDLAPAELLPDDIFKSYAHVRNTLDRLTDTTGDAGSLFSLGETVFNEMSELLNTAKYLSVYVRVAEGFEKPLLGLFEQAASVGFGADVSVGKGHFDLVSGLEAVEWLDDTNAKPNGFISLSTFQPGNRDPTDGLWDAFTTFGKTGPDLGLENVFKRPLVMLRAGACFRGAQREFVGRAVPMNELLSVESRHHLEAIGVNLVQYAYGLAVPACL